MKQTRAVVLSSLGFLAGSLGNPGFAQEDLQRAAPLFSRLHTVSIHVKDFQTFNEVFRFLKDDMELPLNWGREWTPGNEGKKSYASFWAGNICIEPCGPYSTDEFEGNARTMFFALTFLPFESSKASATELEKRGLGHDGQKAFLSVTNRNLSGGNCGVCIMDLGHESRAKDTAREAELQFLLESTGGGPFGVVGVDEILVRYRSEAGKRCWGSLLLQARKLDDNLWKLDDGPTIRLIESSNTGLAGLVLKVRSLSEAKKELEARDMLGKAGAHEVQIAQEKACGLTVILRE